MPRKVKEMSAIQVSRLVEPGFYAVGGVPGLHLQVESAERRSWILRAKVGAKRRDIGLGGFPAVTLSQARDKAREKRDDIEKGHDPVLMRRQARSALIAEQASAITFDEAARRFIAAKGGEWRNPKHRAQWLATLTQYASPIIGSIHVADVMKEHVLEVLEQKEKPDGPTLWASKTETASRVRGRIENVLDWAKARGHRKSDNPARWRGHLDKLLARPAKISKPEHHPALPVADVGAFVKDLRAREGTAARALELLIFTAARSGDVRGALWSEIDLDAATWTIPGGRMKAGREHRVPLAPPAVVLLRALPRFDGVDLVFPAPNSGTMSDMTLTAVIRRMNEAHEKPRWIDPKSGKAVVPHGFRSTFRDWCRERTNYPHEIAEAALAHVITDKTVAAYARGDLFEKRARMMAEWAKFCTKVETKGAVVPMNRAA
jgi:integrase